MTKKKRFRQPSSVLRSSTSVLRPRSSVFSLQSSVCRRRQAAAGFTLLELMTVMVIMFILMGMSTLALRGLVRGAGISGAVSNVRSMLTQARQQAIMNQQRTAVIFDQSGTVATMQILTSYGRVASGGGNAFVPENDLSWDASELKDVVVYNFRGGKGKFTGVYEDGEYFTEDDPFIDWKDNPKDDIAFQVGAIRSLPDGMEFGPNPPVVVFNADGSAQEPKPTITLLERNAPNKQGFTISVVPQTGWIEVQEPGETSP